MSRSKLEEAVKDASYPAWVALRDYQLFNTWASNFIRWVQQPCIMVIIKPVKRAHFVSSKEPGIGCCSAAVQHCCMFWRYIVVLHNEEGMHQFSEGDVGGGPCMWLFSNSHLLWGSNHISTLKCHQIKWGMQSTLYATHQPIQSVTVMSLWLPIYSLNRPIKCNFRGIFSCPKDLLLAFPSRSVLPLVLQLVWVLFYLTMPMPETHMLLKV